MHWLTEQCEQFLMYDIYKNNLLLTQLIVCNPSEHSEHTPTSFNKNFGRS